MSHRTFLRALVLSLLAASTPGCTLHPSVSPSVGVAPVVADSKAAAVSPQGTAFEQWCAVQIRGMRDGADTLKRDCADLPPARILARFNEIEIFHDDAANRSGLSQLTHPDAAVRAAAVNCEQDASALFTDLMLDPDLYRCIVAVNAADPSLDEMDRRFRDKVLHDFTRNGVDRDAAARYRVRALNKRMVELSQTFEKNLAVDTRTVEVKDPTRLSGLPQDFIDAHPPDAHGVRRISTDWPDWYPVMTYAEDDGLREELWRLGWSLGYPANMAVLKDLLQARHDLARTLGYANWAAYATEPMMIRTPEAARRFIDHAQELARPGGAADLADLLAFKRRAHPDAAQVWPWEKSYLQRLVQAERWRYDPDAARSYFDLAKVQKGLLSLSERLFGVTFIPAPDAEVWHPDVQAFEVTQAGAKVGRIYLDLYPREDKYKSCAMFTVKSGVKGLRTPEMAIVGNFADPSRNSGPTLVDHLDVETFFHEFGHLLHGLLGGDSRYVRFSGVSAEWDFVEVPSQLYEEWTWDPKVLAAFATNAAGDPIPADLVRRMHAAERFGKGLFVMQQMFYAAVSLGVHEVDPADFDPDCYAQQMQRAYSPWPVIEDTHFVASFGHLIGYSSNYYTYMWSLVIEKDLYSVFAAKGLLDTDTSMRYRRAILQPGGSRDAADMVTDFLGRPFSYDAYQAWLTPGGDTQK